LQALIGITTPPAHIHARSWRSASETPATFNAQTWWTVIAKAQAPSNLDEKKILRLSNEKLDFTPRNDIDSGIYVFVGPVAHPPEISKEND
jgi:hypothetical protein